MAATIVGLYEHGQSVYQIADRVGLCPLTVGRVLKDQGIVRRGNRQASRPLFAEASPAGTAEEASGASPPPSRESEKEVCSETLDDRKE